MSVLKCSGKTVELDENGFLLNLEDRDEDVAQSLAATVGVDTLKKE